MSKVTAFNLVHAIGLLPRNRDYDYISPKTRTKIAIESVTEPGGPISIRRWDPTRGESRSTASVESISENAIWRYANAFSEGVPVHVDRVFGGSYNIRSALEALVAYTPEFYWCTPGRSMNVNGVWSVEKGHKHVMWLPDTPHPMGVLTKAETDMVVSELPTQAAVYDDILLPPTISAVGESMSDEDLRKHTMIQIALYIIGLSLGFSTYIAQNDQGIQYKGKKLVEHKGMLHSLGDSKLLSNFGDAVSAGRLIDVVWFQNDHLMPAVMEVEHTTGVTSGLSRMLNFRDKAPFINARYVIVADDELRDKVFKECAKPQFADLKACYFPYSAVEELYAFCSRKSHLVGVSEDFLDNFMEPAWGNQVSVEYWKH
ncbi:MAG: hypothetical protein IJ203_02080 [Atopobiaceae bacterium]|nr:hypothetical protein [Atopobiaceae bacterium]